MTAASPLIDLWCVVAHVRASRAVPPRLKTQLADAALGVTASRSIAAGHVSPEVAREALCELLDALKARGVDGVDIAAIVNTHAERSPRPAPLGETRHHG